MSLEAFIIRQNHTLTFRNSTFRFAKVKNIFETANGNY